MNTEKLLLLSLLCLTLNLNSCAQNTTKPSTPAATKKTTLPPHTYTYTPPSKTKTSTVKTTPAKSTTAKTTTVKTVVAKTTSASSKSTTTTVVTPTQNTQSSSTVSTNSNSNTQTSGKASMGTSTTSTTNTTSTNSTQQNTGSGKSARMGNSSSSGSSTNTSSNQSSTGNILSTVLGSGSGSFTEGDAASAIKEALMKGVTTGVNKVSITDGYFKNGMIKIPFPQDAKVVETTLRNVGMGSMIDNLILSLNRAAEGAANQAGPIFVNGIKQMTITDAVNIVSNKQPDAATQFLQRTTTESLVTAFKPAIQTALDKTLATKYWKDIMSNYNKIPFVQKVNPDLNDFVTRKAISGLFYMVGQEEAKIRKDPVGQGSKIIETVFGSVLKR